MQVQLIPCVCVCVCACVCVCVTWDWSVGCGCVCVLGGWWVFGKHGSHFPSRLNIMQIHTHTHTDVCTHANGKRWNIITVRAAVSRPLTQVALCSNADTHIHTLQTQTQAFHIANIITAITSDSNITLHLDLASFPSFLASLSCFWVPMLEPCITIRVCVCVWDSIMLYKHYLS